MTQPEMRGLTHEEVLRRTQEGKVNRATRSEWRDYVRIVRRHVITWFNVLVTPAAVALFVLQEHAGALSVSAMAIINTSIGLWQEIRAKLHLDKLAILAESKARVVREGNTQSIPAGEVVLGDVVLLQSGESIVADGPVLESRFLEVDEALLTGESDPVLRKPGEMLLSGSFCVAGEGVYRADRVGNEAFAQRTAAQARRVHHAHSPLTRVIDTLVQILSYTALALILIYSVSYWLDPSIKSRSAHREFVRKVAATITSMVPQGMVLTATWSFTLGALRMSRQGAVVQQLHAVETMAAIDVICTDKTGTLTSNRLHLEYLEPAHPDVDTQMLRERLRWFASASIDRRSKSIQAIHAAVGEAPSELLDQIPFKSQNRYSAVRTRHAGSEHVLVLGAFEALQERMRLARPAVIAEIERRVHELQRRGLRVLLFGELNAAEVVVFPSDPPRLPLSPLEPVAVLGLGDELRPDAGRVLQALWQQGIAFKIVSGDNPETVQATVSQLDLPLAQEPVVSGVALAESPCKEQLILHRSVFGRVLPEQKLDIVRVLKQHGRHVAMIGDGVNDVLPIKQADLGIAMGEGSQATKTVAGLVLENNEFALLPETLEEGRTIVRNLRRSAKLFLTKNVYSLLLILGAFFGYPFPYLPQQVTLLNWLVIGIPAFVIALSKERSVAPTKPRFLREVGSFALRTGIPFALAGPMLLWFSKRALHPHVVEHGWRTMLLSTLIVLSITSLFRALRDGESETLAGDVRHRLLGLLAVPVYLFLMYWQPSQYFFALAALSLLEWGIVVWTAGTIYFLTRVLDKWATFHV